MSHLIPPWVVRLQDGLARLLGTTVDGRSLLVAGMLRRDAREVTSYWLQLVVSVGIATLGLVVGSAAVVIGAMLVAPLMGPIVGLGMGLATGSPFLVLRSAGRIGASVLVASGGAAVITLMLPFHELNAEIAARTSPTALDLITAGFCALAGVFASLRPGSDTVATAAGTSIGISLVPPLCASGYGLGTGVTSAAVGAGLLFLTNLVAIVVVGTVAFVAAGFNRVDVAALERDELAREGAGARIAGALARRLSTVFASRWGPVLRFLMPFALLAAVYVPLRRALDEVAWQVRARAVVRAALAREEASRVVQTRVRVDRHEVEVVLVLLGTAEEADAARSRIDTEVRRASGVVPRIEVLAVPDAAAFAGLESTLLKPAAVEPSRAAPPTIEEQLASARARVRSTVEGLWPSAVAGAPLVVDLGTSDAGPLRIRVVHLGEPLSQDGAETIRRGLEAVLGRETQLVDVAVPKVDLTRAGGDLQLVAQVASGVRATAGVPGVSVCVVQPAQPRGRAAPADLELARALDETLATHPRVTAATGERWVVRFAEGSCPAPPGLDAGAPDADIPPDASSSPRGGATESPAAP